LNKGGTVHPTDELGTRELHAALGSVCYFYGAPEVGDAWVSKASLSRVVASVGRKAEKRWVATPAAVGEAILKGLALETASDGHAFLIVGRNDAGNVVLQVKVHSDEEAVIAEIRARIRSTFMGDEDAKKVAAAAQALRSERRRQEEAVAHLEGGVRLQANAAMYRSALRGVSAIMRFQSWAFRDIPRLAEGLRKLSEAQRALDTHADRSGNVDGFVDAILRGHNQYSIEEAPELLSGVGILVTSNEALNLLEVYDRYLQCTTGSGGGLGYDVVAGYRPHTDLIKGLPRSCYAAPRYLAPVEDLLDWAAVQLMKEEWQPEPGRGAVGWLVDVCVLRLTEAPNAETVAKLAESTEYWTASGIGQCLKTWRDIVRPILVEHKVWIRMM
jgi:hypothetical protein